MSSTNRRWPTARQRATLRRHLVQVLRAPMFRQHVTAFRSAWQMRRVTLTNSPRSIWVVSKARTRQYLEQRAVFHFGEFWFRNLGSEWLAGRLIADAAWDEIPVAAVVEELATVLEEEAPTDREWKQTVRSRDLSQSTAYYAGYSAFHPTAIWEGAQLATDLRTGAGWHAEVSSARVPALTRTRTFIEVFSWTDEEDVRRAFQQTRQYQPSALPKEARPRRDVSSSLTLYQRYAAGEDIEGLREEAGLTDERSLRRHLSDLARMLGLPLPRRVKRRTRKPAYSPRLLGLRGRSRSPDKHQK